MPEKDPQDPKDPKDPKDPADPKDPKDPKDPDPKDPDPKEPEMIPKGKADQWYKDKKEAERRAEEAERKLSELEEDEKRKKGEFEELANKYKSESETKEEELKRIKEEREKDDEVFKTMLQSELDSIPEDRQGLIPEDYSVRQKLSYIAANRDALAAVGGGAKGEKGQPKSKDDKKPSDELSALEAEREELFKKSREQGGLMGADANRMREITRKIVELKKV